jgi:hypothetical protein
MLLPLSTLVTSVAGPVNACEKPLDAKQIRDAAVTIDGFPIFYWEVGPPGTPVLILLHGCPLRAVCRAYF